MSRVDRPPEIDYLAKDFASFRQLMLDQMALLIPDWQERHPADLGNTLVEILAYAADYLSYAQDAIATEAYLGTARLRRSVRRHVRLLDYNLHNGCNARAWVHITLQPGSGDRCLPKGTWLLAGVERHDGPVVTPDELAGIMAQDSPVQVYITMHDVQLSASQPEIAFYVQDRTDVMLRRGAVSARLVDNLDQQSNRRALDDLQVGDVLIFEQRLDPESGLSTGIDPSHRHAMRLTRIERTSLEQWRSETAHSARPAPSVPPVAIHWDQSDALPFDLFVGPYRSAATDAGAPARELSVALRNIVLVDHGAPVGPETLPAVTTGKRYRPLLARRDVTYTTSYNHSQARRQPASATIAQHPYEAQAAVELTEQRTHLLPESEDHPPLLRKSRARSDGAQLEAIHRWVQRRDLLSSDRTARTFAVETEDDGRAYLRLGYGGLGKGLSAASTLVAAYRIGNGSLGNVGRHAIAHLVLDDRIDSMAALIHEVRNPLPVTTGVDAESIETARLSAPHAFQTPLSCVSPADFAAQALQLPSGGVREARARIERTGNWQTVFVYVQRQQGLPIDPAFSEQLLGWLRPRAMSGYEVAIRPPIMVALDLHLRVWVAPHRFRNAVRQAVQEALGNGLQENGARGFFHPDNLGFGRSLYRSAVIRAAMAVDAVDRVEIVRFNRQDDSRALDPLPMGELEIARLDANPDKPEYGTLRVDMAGGL